jgi:hypothetical protein
MPIDTYLQKFRLFGGWKYMRKFAVTCIAIHDALLVRLTIECYELESVLYADKP